MLISSPEDYGLTKEQTLAFAVTETLPPWFESFWSAFREEVSTLPTRWHGTVDGGVSEVVIPSMRSVRVVGRLALPGEPPRGLVIRLHGADPPEVFEDDPDGFATRGLATLQLRVRGFPPSVSDVADLRAEWILRDLESAGGCDWIVRAAVGDVVQSIRCARRHFGDALPISIQGESLGGGLAVIAAAQLERLSSVDASSTSAPVPHRIVAALPSLGAWRWRSGRYCNGMGRRVNESLTALRDESSRVMDVLPLFDAALHARSIEAPSLVKLAARDDVVPAPSAAAVFNGLASSRKWRYVTDYGHYDGGITDARRHVRFERVVPRFLDPCEDPGDAAASLLD